MQLVLLLAMLAEAAVPKVRVATPMAGPSVKVALPTLSAAPSIVPSLAPFVGPAANESFIRVSEAPELAEAEAARLAEKFDHSASPLSAKISRRIEELKRKFEQERVAGANALNASDDLGLGHVAEIVVIKHEEPRLINVSEEVVREGSIIGEIDAETTTHLIEVASGRLDSGKKSKVQQFVKFLRPEAKRRGKAVKYFFNPKKADPDDIDRIIKMGERQGVRVEFEPIPWQLDLLKGWKLF